MEALALLCTLHADGPATLQRLRRGGCPDLAAVEALPAEELARLVGISASAARRLAREAALLRERLVPGDADSLLDQEEAPENLQRLERPAAALDGRDRDLIRRVLARPMPDGVRPSSAPERPDAEAAPAAPDTGSLSALERAGEPTSPQAPDSLAAAVSAPSLGGAAPVDLEGHLPVDEGPAECGPEECEPDTVEAVEPEAPAEPMVAGLEGTPLEPGTVDGLGATELAVLADEGITTLEELAATDVGDCARATGLPFSSVARWIFLARRGGQLPAPPAPDAPFGTGVMEAESRERESAATPQAVGEPLDRLDPQGDGPAAEALVEAAASEAFGACVFDEPRTMQRPHSLEPTAELPDEPTEERPETAVPESPVADRTPEEKPTPVAVSEPEPAPMEPAPAAEGASLEAFEAPQPITEDPTVRPPFWQVRAEWRAESCQSESSQSESSQSEDTQSELAQPMVPEAPVDQASSIEPPAPEPEDASLGWDFVIPSGPATTAGTSEENSRVDTPAEGIGGPFA